MASWRSRQSTCVIFCFNALVLRATVEADDLGSGVLATVFFSLRDAGVSFRLWLRPTRSLLSTCNS